MLKTSKQSQHILNGVSLHLHLIGSLYCSQLSRRFFRWNAPELKSRSLPFLLGKAHSIHWYSCVQPGHTLWLFTNLTHEHCLGALFMEGHCGVSLLYLKCRLLRVCSPNSVCPYWTHSSTCVVTCVHTSHYNIGMYTHVHAYRLTCMQRHMYTCMQTKTHKTNINK